MTTLLSIVERPASLSSRRIMPTLQTANATIRGNITRRVGITGRSA